MRATRAYGPAAERALGMWVKLARAFATMSRLTGEDIRRYGLTQAQFGVLETLGHKGRMTLGDLAHKSLSTGGNITVVVNNLVRDGLVRRTVSPLDRRVVYVALTPRGSRLFRRIFPQHAEAVARIAAVLPPADQERLGELLRVLGKGAEAQEISSNLK
jgi:MarR family transcriptional regulator, 2-MHQ and catechol-resistance regulon repressor